MENRSKYRKYNKKEPFMMRIKKKKSARSNVNKEGWGLIYKMELPYFSVLGCLICVI